jgi:hypothetical protein
VNQKKKALCLFLVLIIFFVFCITGLPYANAITNFYIELSDRNPGHLPSYTIHVTLNKTLKVHEYIKIIFPKEA